MPSALTDLSWRSNASLAVQHQSQEGEQPLIHQGGQDERAQQHKLRKTRRDKGTRLMTARDLWVLRWIGEQYAVRFDQLQQLLSREPGHHNEDRAPGPHGITDSAVDQVIRRWTLEPSWVVYERIYNNAPGWIWLTRSCERLLELPYARHNVRESRLSHRYYNNCVRLDIERRHPEYRWVSERTLLSQLPRRSQGDELPHIPDAEVWLSPAGTVAVEVELSPKDDVEIDAILLELLAGEPPRYRTVWYFVSDADPVYGQAHRVVQAAFERLPATLQPRMKIIPLEKVGVSDDTITTAAPDSRAH